MAIISSPINTNLATRKRSTAKQTVSKVSNILSKNNKEKKDISSRIFSIKRKRAENDRKNALESQLEASNAIKFNLFNPVKMISSSTGGIFKRILNAMGYLAAGWIMRNLPTWIAMAKEFIARLQETGRIMSGFVSNVSNLFLQFGNILSSIGQNIITFDLMDSNKRVSNAFDELLGTINNMGQQIEDAFDVFSTPLSKGTYSGENAPPPGSNAPSQLYERSPSGEQVNVSGNISNTQRQALDILSKYESASAGGYNAVNQIGVAGGRGVSGYSGDFRKMKQHGGRSLTDMTIAEIMALQTEKRGMSNQEWIRQGRLHAVGRYQFIGMTLPGVVKRAGIPVTAKFTPQVQDLLALQLLKEAGIGSWVGPSDRATRAERAIVERARREPINYKPSISMGSNNSNQSQSQTSQQTTRNVSNVNQSSLPKLPPTDTLSNGSQRYGAWRRGGRRHAGVDFDISGNQKFFSRIGGKVTRIDYDPGGYGNYIDIYNQNLGVYERIAEAAKILVRKGQSVNPGEAVVQGESSTGVIHYEIRKNSGFGFDNTVNPIQFLSSPKVKSGEAQVAEVSSPSSSPQEQQPELEPERTGPLFLIFDDFSQQSQTPTVISSPSISISLESEISQSNMLNTFMKNKLLLDLAYL